MLLDDIQNMPKPTAQEHAVIEYILKHPEAVATSTVRELAQASFTSAPTIVRLCQKLGFSGFPEFRLQFVTEQKASQKGFYADFTHALVSPETSVEDIQRMLPQFYNSIAHEANAHISSEQLETLKNVLQSAKAIDIYGTGINYHVAKRSAFLLQTLGMLCSVYDEANVHMLERFDRKSGHLSLLLSHTGKNVKILEIAQILIKRDLPTIAIVADASSPLGEMADATIELFSTATPNRLSIMSYAISLGYVFDLLYASMLVSELGNMFPESSSSFYEDLSERHHL